MSKKQTYNAVIIGAGNIASRFDTPKSTLVLTHAHALSNHPRIQLVGMMDTNVINGKKEAKKWKTNFYADYHEMLKKVQPDIVVVATPSVTHKEVLIDVLHSKPKVVIMEKPVVDEKREIALIRRIALKSGVPVIVNFRRRFDPALLEVRDALVKGTYGSVLSASAMYSKGIMHNGSHIMDLARYFFGEMLSAKAMHTIDDFNGGEPTVGGFATFERCPQFYFMAGDERSFYVFEFEIVTEKYRIRFIDEGRRISIQKVERDTMYKDDRVLGKTKMKESKLNEAMTRMVAHAVSVADGVVQSHSSLEEGLRTQEACYKFLESLKK